MDTLQHTIIATGTLAGIEATQHLPVEEPLKVGLQILLGIINLIFIIKKRRLK